MLRCESGKVVCTDRPFHGDRLAALRPDPGAGEVRVEVPGVNPTDGELPSGATPRAIDREAQPSP